MFAIAIAFYCVLYTFAKFSSHVSLLSRLLLFKKKKKFCYGESKNARKTKQQPAGLKNAKPKR